jgi:hypothetical protein
MKCIAATESRRRRIRMRLRYRSADVPAGFIENADLALHRDGRQCPLGPDEQKLARASQCPIASLLPVIPADKIVAIEKHHEAFRRQSSAQLAGVAAAVLPAIRDEEVVAEYRVDDAMPERSPDSFAAARPRPPNILRRHRHGGRHLQ